MEVEIGDLVQERTEHYGITFGIVQRIIEEQKSNGTNERTLQLCTTDNPHLIWCTYNWSLKYNYGKSTVEEAKEKYPERLI